MDEETHPRNERSDGRDAAVVVCALCGASANSETPPGTWTCSVENGSRQYVCDTCARTHIRAIESRLDSAWW
ncbi:hypothetical protein ACFY1C_12055 [Streptomyces sp. NPDC001279]|uniref:hypothetical protein n=1 Tax=Streptomyces sp. NPDC001279 TaxID=3364556 RepID=UPI0036B42A1C